MRIVYVNSLFPTERDQRAIGGAETFSVRLLQGMLDAGHEVTIVRSGTAQTDAVDHTASGVPVHSIPPRYRYPFGDGRSHDPVSRFAWHLIEDRANASAAFGRILATVKPDLLHTNNVAGLTTDLWRVARSAGLPIVHTLHDYYLTCPRVMRFARGGRCTKTCLTCGLLSQQRRKAARNVDKVVAVSQRLLDIHRAEGLFNDTPSQVILNKPPPQRASAAHFPRPLGPQPVFGYIGRQAPEKGIYELLGAFVQLEPGAARLVIAGAVEPAVREWIKQNVKRPEDVTLTGFTTQDAFFPTIDVAVIPSIWEEPCSMGAGEAFSFGVPALGSRRGGIPEMLEFGRFGWLFEPGTDELAALMARLVANPAEIASKAETVRTETSQDTDDQLVTSYLDLYADFVGQRPRVSVPA